MFLRQNFCIFYVHCQDVAIFEFTGLVELIFNLSFSQKMLKIAPPAKQ